MCSNIAPPTTHPCVLQCIVTFPLYTCSNKAVRREMAIPTAFCVALVCAIASLVDATALDDYVSKPDSHYRYSDLGNPYRGAGYTTYFLNMTSQKWLNGACFMCATVFN